MPLLQFALTYIISVVVLFVFSILFMQGAYISLLPFVAFVPATILKKALFAPRYEEDPEEVY